MPSFARPEKQAAKAIRRSLALGEARHGQREDGRIHSVGTARGYLQTLKGLARWDRANGGRGLQHLTHQRALAYLYERAKAVCQKTLDLDRQAIETVLPQVEGLPRVRSEIASRGHGERPRAYTAEQIGLIAQAQSPRYALATEIAAAAGLRAHELLTLLPADERPPSRHREWGDERFRGLDNPTRYTVVGKGGLVREIAIPTSLAARLEATRLPAPLEIMDRGVRYQQRYDIAGGQRWSSSYSQAAKRALGWSTGAHGVRHTYGQSRMDTLQGMGMSYPDALAIVSQEMGHFRGNITEVYLR